MTTRLHLPRPCLARLADHLGGSELGTGLLERVMREFNVRTDIGGSRWNIAGLRDLLTVQPHGSCTTPPGREIHRATHRPAPSHSRRRKFNG